MIISHQHRYLFVELPHTGSTAISDELRTYYDGKAILYKHATYHEFLRVASPEEKQYSIFSAVRHPADDVVSYFFKYKHRKFTFFKEHFKLRKLIYWRQYQRAKLVLNEGIDFPTFFVAYYRLPYDNWSALSHHQFDFILRFEHLSDDFAILLEKLHIEAKRRLPVIHKTPGRQQEFWSYYPPETWDHAKRIFGPYMKKWGYEFPPEWGEWSVSPLQQAQFETLRAMRKAQWLYIRPLIHRLLVLERMRAAPQTGGDAHR